MKIRTRVRLKSDSPQEIRDALAANDEVFGEVDAIRKPGVCRVEIPKAIDGVSYLIGPNHHYVDVLEIYLEEVP